MADYEGDFLAYSVGIMEIDGELQDVYAVGIDSSTDLGVLQGSMSIYKGLLKLIHGSDSAGNCEDGERVC